MSFLKNHPFAVEAFFESSLVITYAVPKAELQALIPECLSLDLLNDTWGFVAIALVQTKDLRPKGFPKILGRDFFLIGCRIFVRYTDRRGKKLRGLYILKSETDRAAMTFFGNLFTHYKYTTTDIRFERRPGAMTIDSVKSGLHLSVDPEASEVALPVDSPFADWKEARRFAGPLPFTFTWNPEKQEVLVIEGVRENWTPKPVEVNACHIDFIDQLALPGAVMANAFIIEQIPYQWKKGRIEKWER